MNDKQRQIYSRQIMLPEMGDAGQELLSNASVLVVGAGGLGSPLLLYLAALGIGRLTVVDGDIISLSNLNRQLLYTPADVGEPKVARAAARLRELNPWLEITAHQLLLDESNAEQLIAGHDIVADCLDNFATRFVLNDACVQLGIPFVHAGVGNISGQTLTVLPGEGPCLRCIFPNGAPKDMPGPKGIIGATAGIFASIQAQEIYKYLVGLPVNSHALLAYDGLLCEWQRVELQPRPGCVCQKR